MIIGVIGGNSASKEALKLARETGRLIAKSGCTLICGGRAGIMEASCRGAKDAGGLTIGVMPGIDNSGTNKYVDIPILTGMGLARNVIIVRTADACIAIDGSYGTLSEIALALNSGTPIIALKSWDVPACGNIEDGLFFVAKTPSEAVKLAIKHGANKYKKAPHAKF